MKKISSFLLLLLVIGFTSYSQTFRARVKSSSSDPAIENLSISNPTGGLVNTDMLVNGSPVKIQFTVSNKVSDAVVPAGSCRIMLTLGTKFTVATNMNNSQNLPLSNYFKWMVKQAPDSKQYVLFGILEQDLPANFLGNVSFLLIPSKEGTSTVVCQLLVSNENNPTHTLSDVNPNNNYASLSYTNVKPLDIKFTKFTAQPHACMLDLNWVVYDKDNAAKQFVVETSSDNGVTFNVAQTIAATNGLDYSFLLDKFLNASTTVRIKAETDNGQYVYSDNITNNDICNKNFDVTIYPNPIPAEVKEVTLFAKTGIFNGKYSIKLTNAAGTEISRTENTYQNQVQIKVKIGTLATGIYFVTLRAEDGKTVMLKIVRK